MGKIEDIFNSNILYCKEAYAPFIKGRTYECIISKCKSLITIKSNYGNMCFVIDFIDNMNKLQKHFTTIKEHRTSIINELL